MRKIAETDDGEILVALIRMAQANRASSLRGKEPSPYRSEQFLGRCSKEAARLIRGMLLEIHGVRVKLRPRGHALNAPGLPCGSRNSHRSEALRYHPECAIYLRDGKKAKNVMQIVEERTRMYSIRRRTLPRGET